MMPRSASACATATLLVIVVAASVVACSRGAEPVARPSPTEACGAVQMPPVQSGSHLLGDAEPPVPYTSTPPTSGWHSSVPAPIAVYPVNEPLTEPQHVSVLEAGGVVVSHGQLDPASRTSLVDEVERRFSDRVAVTAYGELGPGELAFAAWGVLQRCQGVDLDALDRFVAAHAPEAPDAPTEHASG